MRQAIVVDDKFYAVYSAAGLRDYLREHEGVIVALGDTWENYAVDNGINVPLLPMEEQETPHHNTPVIVDGRVIWTLPNE